MKRLDLVVGPNGAGKTTFVTAYLAPRLPGLVFVNADEIAKRQWPGEDPVPHAYEAAQIAGQAREQLIGQGASFIAETVFSHPSKLELIRTAQAAGYTVNLWVLLVPENLAVARVDVRVESGGHAVPEDKIRDRYARLWSLVVEAIALADTAVVVDNSRIADPHSVVHLNRGLVTGAVTWPTWTPSPLRQHWPATADLEAGAKEFGDAAEGA